MNVMVDLETLGNGPTAVIIAIGAVEFDPATGELGREFYQVVDAQSCVDVGLVMDASTVMWWMQQDAAARGAFRDAGRHIARVVMDFAEWCPPKMKLWGNGAAFDNVILTSAYKAVCQPISWDFRSNMCYRTLRTLRPEIEMNRIGTYHNALDDAKSQAIHAMAILKDLQAEDMAESTTRVSRLEAENAQMRAELDVLHKKHADSMLHAETGWARYESANRMRNQLLGEVQALRGAMPAVPDWSNMYAAPAAPQPAQGEKQ